MPLRVGLLSCGVCFMLPDAVWQGTVGIQQRPELAMRKTWPGAPLSADIAGRNAGAATLGQPGPVYWLLQYFRGIHHLRPSTLSLGPLLLQAAPAC